MSVFRLTNEGITPSSSTTHTYAALVAALKAQSGVEPQLECDGSDLSEVYWYFNLRGSVIDGDFEMISKHLSVYFPSHYN